VQVPCDEGVAIHVGPDSTQTKGCAGGPARWPAAWIELLAGSHDGCTDAVLLAHGFSVPLLVELVRTAPG
jgi:hypothetical protein